MPAIGQALKRRQIGFTAAGLVARAAMEDPKSAAAWVQRAIERPVKYMHEDVRAALLFGTGRPPTPEEVETMIDLERLACGYVDPSPTRQISGSPDSLGARVRVPATPVWHDKWCALERAYEKWASPYGSFIDSPPAPSGTLGPSTKPNNPSSSTSLSANASPAPPPTAPRATCSRTTWTRSTKAAPTIATA
jgi:hypothetical protein